MSIGLPILRDIYVAHPSKKHPIYVKPNLHQVLQSAQFKVIQNVSI